MSKRRLFLLIFVLTIVLGSVAIFVFAEERHPLPPLAAFSSVAPTSQPIRAKLGRFEVEWRTKARRERLAVYHQSEPRRILWQNPPGRGWLATASGREEVKEERGSFFVKEDILASYPFQSVKKVEIRLNEVVFEGDFSSAQASERIPYRFRFFVQTDQHLGFSAQVLEPRFNRLTLSYRSSPQEKIVGFGEQFTYIDMKGRRLPILVMEQGIGRGAQPITWGANLTAKAGGSWHTTYIGVPHYFTSENRSLFLENSEYSVFDFRRPKTSHVSVFSSNLRGRILYGRGPLEMIETYTTYAGRMPVLPDWSHRGAIIGMQGGSAKVLASLKALQKHKTPIAAFWLQDWVGQRKTSFGKQLWWNWELDTSHYPEWKKLVETLKAAGSRVLLYINPFLADVSAKKGTVRRFLKEAVADKHLVLKPDKTPYFVKNTSFSAALLDLSSERTRTFLKKVIQTQMIDIGASGWMADFGEALPFDAILASGEPASRFHNRYPEVWAQVNQEAIAERGRKGDIVFFTRAGFTQSPRFSTLFWLGDQLVSWDEYDGIKSAVTGLLSGGFSGFSLNHSDIGGYTTISNPLKNYHRSKELFWRWAELNAFSPIFRTHEGNQPDKNHQFRSEPATLAHFSRMAKLFAAWFPYRKHLFQEAASKGLPVIRHLLLHYPDDPEVWKIRYRAFLIGAEWLFAPVLDPGLTSLSVYLPKGRWIHLWSGLMYGDTSQGRWIQIDAPLGSPALFFKEGSASGEAFRLEIRRLGLLSTK